MFEELEATTSTSMTSPLETTTSYYLVYNGTMTSIDYGRAIIYVDNIEIPIHGTYTIEGSNQTLGFNDAIANLSIGDQVVVYCRKSSFTKL